MSELLVLSSALGRVDEGLVRLEKSYGQPLVAKVRCIDPRRQVWLASQAAGRAGLRLVLHCQP